MNNVVFSSDRQEWRTPPDFFKRLDDEFRFVLDAAASNSNHLCWYYLTKGDDALTVSWRAFGGAVWCNPPYGTQVKKFVKKAAEEAKKTKHPIVLLIPARTDTRWFHEFILGQAEIRFVKGRLRFSGARVNAPFPSMVVIYNSPNGNQIGAMDR